MEILHNGFTLNICPGGFPLSTDSIALSGFVTLPKNARVLDLGAGCGTLGLLLCASDEHCCVTGVELSERAHAEALKNIERNQLSSRLESICADLRDIPTTIKAGSFTTCVSNPPYFPSGPQSQKTPLARREDTCTLDDLFKAASWSLQYGGDFFLVHRPERLAEVCVCGAKYNLEVKKMRLLRHRQDGPISLIMVQCRKGGKPGLTWEEVTLHYPDGTPTNYYKSLYHQGG